MQGDWGEKIIKDIKRGLGSYENTEYIGCRTMLTQIVYKALGMQGELKRLELDGVVML